MQSCKGVGFQKPSIARRCLIDYGSKGGRIVWCMGVEGGGDGGITKTLCIAKEKKEKKKKNDRYKKWRSNWVGGDKIQIICT